LVALSYQDVNMFKNLAAVLTAALLCSNGAIAQQKVSLLANTSPPYSDQKLPEQGLAIELVTHIYKRAGYQPQIRFESWPRAMEGVKIGLYDALAAAWYTQSRSEEYLYSEPYLSSKLVLVKLRSDQSDYFQLAHLSGKRLGVRVDYAYGVDFDAIPNLKLVRENHVIQNLLRLLNGSVDLVIGDQRTLALQMHEYLGKSIQKFQVVDMALPDRDRHVAASRTGAGREKMIAAFNQALAASRKDGSHAAIVAKWDKRYSMPATN
jgi:polar amino acid transport system substrate-binding protein